MRIKKLSLNLSKFELILWLVSVLTISVSFLATSEKNYLSLIASLIGATALIFVSKGYVSGQILTVVFSIFYGVISFYFRYYGEMITYLCMTTPMAVMSVISWIKNPYGNTKEVKVSTISPKGLEARVHVQEMQFLEGMDRDEIKRIIYEYGPVQTSLYMT